MARDEGYTRRALEPFLADFYRATVAGVRDSRTKYPDTSHLHRKTTRRSLARDHIVYELRRRIEGNSRVRVSDRNQTTYFVIDGEYKILIKKASEDGMVVLNDNQASLGFQANVEEDLFDYDQTNLYLSPIDNEVDPLEPSVMLICPNEGGCKWMFEILPPAAEIAATISGPTTPAPLDGEEERLVRLPTIEKTDEESE